MSLSGEQLEIIRSVRQHMQRAADDVASWEKYQHILTQEEQLVLGDVFHELLTGAEELSAALATLEKA